jgi:multiple sugar transport system ATP-binding protein
VEEAARVLGITHFLDRKPKALSGGQRQRVALGRAIVREPRVFLLDEPLSNLDAKLRTSMRTELIKLHKQLETTFVYVTHDQTEAMTMGDRIVVMSNALVQQVDTPQNLYDTPCNVFVAGFIGSPQMNFIDAVLSSKDSACYLEMGGDRLKIPAEKAAKQDLTQYIGKTVKLGIRPEDIYDDKQFMSSNPDAVIETSVDVSELMGSEVYLYLKYGDGILTARVAPTTTSRTGDSIKVGFDMKKMHLFDVETEVAIMN